MSTGGDDQPWSQSTTDSGDGPPTPADDVELASDLAVAVIRLARHLRVRRHASSPLSLTQLSALTTLYREGPLRATTLAGLERVQPPSMTRILVSLDDAGMIVRQRHPTDGRVVMVTLTPLGSETVTRETMAREHWLSNQLDNSTLSDLAVLRHATHTINTVLGDPRPLPDPTSIQPSNEPHA